MLTISHALSVSRAESYYNSEYANPAMVQSEYYQEKGEARGEWFGALAEEWGIAGPMAEEQFRHAINGRHPVNGEQLVRHVEARRYRNKHGKWIETSAHRAGWDATFSAPKSLVILAYMSGDEELKQGVWEDHIASVKEALAEMEKYSCARVSKDRWERSGKMLAAVFHHERARPDDRTGYAAPEIHTHAVIMNMTVAEDGKVRAMQEREFFRSQSFLTAVYRIRMAERMRRRGVKLRIDRETGAPEVVGITREYIEAASVRSGEINRKAREMQTRLEANGERVKWGAGLKQAAAKLNRQGKKYDKAEMERMDAELEEKFGRQGRLEATAIRERGPIIYSQEEIKERAREAVDYGVERVMEREAVADRRTLMIGALRRNMLYTTYDAVTAEAEKREQLGELIGIERERRMSERTTRRMLAMERENVRRAAEGKGICEAIADLDQAEKLVDEISYRQNVTLNPDQRQAVLALLGARDKVVALQGRAGVGKTTMMRALREAAERSGYAVCGVAPTTMAARELAGSGIKSQTLQSFLSRPRQDGEGKRLIVLDESSLSDTRRINALLKRLGDEERILLVGDRDQHQAVEAGAPFEQLEKDAKIHTVWIKKVVRQREPGYRRVVEMLQEGRFQEAVALLHEQGRIVEVVDERERIMALAERYVARPEGNLAVVPGNRERVFANAVIHGMLQEKGAVDAEDHPTLILTNRDDMTSADRQWAERYKPGEDVVRYREGSAVFGIRKGEYARVTSQDCKENTLTVEFDDGRRVTYDPRRLYGVEVFREAERNFSVGDRIQFRRPFGREVVNGELATVEKIEGGRFTVRTKDGGVITIDTKEFRHFDHGYAITSYLSQGQTSPQEIVHVDTRSSDMLVNRRMARVALTRGVHDALIFTDSLKRLAGALERRKDKEIAGVAVRESAWLEALKAAKNEDLAPVTISPEIGFDDAESNTAGREERAGSSLPMMPPAPSLPATMEASHSPAESPQSGVSNGLHQDQPRRQTAPKWKDRTFTRTVTQYQFEEREGGAPQKLVRVNRRRKCPICDKPSWCSVTEDGTKAICMRVKSEHETRNGGYLHIVEDSVGTERVMAVTVEVKQHTRAEIEGRDAIHHELLGALTLMARDHKNLVKRGLDEAAITRGGYKSVPSSISVHDVSARFKDRDMAGIPGFYKQDGSWKLNVNDWHAGFLVPVRDIGDRIEGFQIRRAEVKTDEPRYVWLSSSNKNDGASSGAPAHFRNPDRVRQTGQVIITEGALKGDTAAHLLGNRHCVIALAGVGSFREDFGRWLRELMPDLRQAVIAFDADAAIKPEVQHQLERLCESLRGAGLDVRELRWEQRQGKGIDDYLLNDPGRRSGVEDFLKESHASLNRGEVSVANPVSRDWSRDESRPNQQEIAL
jgi:conjugative relaxase-like TrwC/TraI family protein